MKQIYIRALALFLLCASFTVHKFYMSLTQVNYVPEKQAVQIIVRLFVDDLQAELNALSSEAPIELDTDREPEDVELRFESYLKSRLSFKIDATNKEFHYIGKEYSDDMAVFYLEISAIDTIRELSIQNKLLINSFPEQENIVKTKIYNKHKSTIFTPEITEALINF